MHTHRHKPATPAPPRPTAAATTLPAAPGNKDRSPRSVAADDVRLCAYCKWERAGKPTGDGIQFWLQAEQELVQGK